jgi:ABC-type bacteriocin/lantibiotic exporter with double-glycine peptidase domain
MSAVSALSKLLKEQTLLGLFLPDSILQQIEQDFVPIHVLEGRNITEEGAVASDLIIILSGEGKLVSRDIAGREVVSGTLSLGRSANLYSVIRNLPFQYSIIASKECEILRIPWGFLRPYAESKLGFLQYLNYMTELSSVRHLRKEMAEIGCRDDFVVTLLGQCRLLKLDSQQWIVNQQTPAVFAFFPIEGRVQAFHQNNNNVLKALWEVPKHTWILWRECALQKESAYSYKCLQPTQILCIDQSVLCQLAADFPTDFEHYQNNIATSKSVNESAEEDETDQVVNSLGDLFPKAIHKRKVFRLTYPFVAQNDDMDCGPACLAMISKYFGKEIPIQFWRERVFTNQEGTSLFDLAKATENVGFTSYSIAIDSLDELEPEVLPCIAVRKYHYLVIYKVTGKYVIIGDPAFGVVKMSRGEFNQDFENAILLLKPNEDFYEMEEVGTTHGPYLSLFEGLWKESLLVLATSFILVVFGFFPPLLSQIIIDEVLSKKDLKLLLLTLGVGTLIAFAVALCWWLRGYYIYFLTSKFDFRFASGFLRKLLSLQYAFFANRHVGDFTRRLSEMERMRIFITTTVLDTLLDLAVLGLYGVILFLYSPWLALLGFVLAPGTTLIAMFFSRSLQSAYGESFRSRAEQEALITDIVKGVSTIKSLNGAVANRWRYEGQLVTTLRANYKFSKTANTLVTGTYLYTQIVRYGMMGAAAYLAIIGTLSPGQVIAVSMIINQIIEPFKNLARSWPSLQEAKTILSRLDDVFLAVSEATTSRGITKPKLRGEIEMQDVWFRYGGESSDWVLKGLSFKVEAGQHVAIVGPSGCGKSTIGYLLTRMYEPTKGHILIDGRDYRDYDLGWLRSQLGLLMQEPRLFFGPVSANIAFGDPSPNDHRVLASAKMAHAHDFILEKSRGYDYLISHEGMGLSGGQRQRLALARTIYTQPSVLILDEATSALDGIIEAKLLESLKENFKGMTILNIAHRYTAVNACDFALVMDKGRAVAFGTNEQLLSEGGLYSELFGLSKKKAA